MKDLPVDVLRKIASYTIGDPKYLKIRYNHIEALERIQNKYKISRLGPKITRHLKSRNKIYIIEYCIMREGVPISLKGIDGIEDIITEENKELLSLIYEEVEDDLNYKVKLDIEVQLVAKLPEKEYGENEFSYREIYFMNDFDEYVDEDNIDEILEKAVEEIQEDIEEDRDKDSIIGIQAFHFKFVIIEDIYY